MAEHTSSPTRGTAAGATSGAGDRASQSTHGSGMRIVDRVKESATAQLSTQKDRATDGLGTVATAVRQTTQTLRDQQHDTVARYVEQAAEQIEQLSERLKGKDVTELLDDAQRLARRQPALFVGGAFALGLAGARFLKSSSRGENEYGRGTYESSGSTSGAYDAAARGRATIGTPASTGDVTGGSTTASTGSPYGASGRDDRERF